MTTDNKDCSGCKWFRPTFKHYRLPYECKHAHGWANAAKNRANPNLCGPSAKYYEPKEQQP